ncbi:MAG: PD-(D/E)XK nuclease family protein [Actinomycetia bacterium]|nr:PD-(D/E)XK nuclease family protein [Actinomycetes bacterium]
MATVQVPNSPTLNPAQERTLALLRRNDEPLVFSEAFVSDLREEANAALAQFHERLGTTTLFINKSRLSNVHGCEGKFLAPDEFQWTAAIAKGQVAHKAIQQMINWRGEPTPSELVDDALARLADDDRDLGRWVAALSRGDEADLRGRAIEHVNKFIETFPPLDPRSHPATESATRWPVDGPIVFNSRADLVMGKPEGRESRKLIIDLKTGWVSPVHREDLRFYALVETLVREVPPRKLATFYLDSAHAMVEDVTEGLLRSALRRTLDGVHAIIELSVEGRTPVLRPGTHCRWCPLRDTCPASEADRSHGADDAGDG